VGRGTYIAAKQSLLLSYRPIVFTDSIDYLTIGFSHYRPNPRSFVPPGVAVDCWQSFDVPSATASVEA